MAARCAADWLPMLTKLGITPCWASKYPMTPNLSSNRNNRNAAGEDEVELDVGHEGDEVGYNEEQSDDDGESDEDDNDDDFD